MKNSIIWLASYPKSGNTWTRVFLANYLLNTDAPLSINQIHRFGLGDSIPQMYRIVGGADIDLTDIHLTTRLRDKVLRGIVNNNADVNFVKTHNFRGSLYGIELIPPKYTRSAVYIMRNPLDAVLSYAKHYNQTIEEATESFSRSDNVNGPDETSVLQYLGSWSDHVNSWTSFSPYPTCILKYEDLLINPEEGFSKLVELVGLPVDEERLKKAIKFSSFKELSSQEGKDGFRERPQHSAKFFNSGQSGRWRKELPKKVADRLIKANRETMQKFGYLE